LAWALHDIDNRRIHWGLPQAKEIVIPAVMPAATLSVTDHGLVTDPNYGFCAQWSSFEAPILPSDAVIQGIYAVIRAKKTGTTSDLIFETVVGTSPNFNWFYASWDSVLDVSHATAVELSTPAIPSGPNWPEQQFSVNTNFGSLGNTLAAIAAAKLGARLGQSAYFTGCDEVVNITEGALAVYYESASPIIEDGGDLLPPMSVPDGQGLAWVRPKSVISGSWWAGDYTNGTAVANPFIPASDTIGPDLTSAILTLDYRYGETASDIENRGSVRVSPYTGKILVIELSRKFSPWTVPASCGGMLATPVGIVPCFSDASGRTYRLDSAKLHDDDYGTIPWDYTTSSFADDQMEEYLQLGNLRHFFSYLSWLASGVGNILITPLADALTNPWPTRGPYPLALNAIKDAEIPLQVSGRKMFLKFSGSPLAGSLDSFAAISRMAVRMKTHPMTPWAGR
jgi:hypothetical protein